MTTQDTGSDPADASEGVVRGTRDDGGYRHFKAIIKRTNQPFGWLTATPYPFFSPWANHACLERRENAHGVKWYRDSSGLYLEKDTAPSDRYLGINLQGYATWALWIGDEVRPLVLNDDGTISLALDPGRKLYMYTEHDDYNYLCWTAAGEDHPNLLRFEPIDLDDPQGIDTDFP